MQRKVLRSLVIESLQSRQLFAFDMIAAESGSVPADIATPVFQTLVAEGEGDHISEHDPFMPDFSSTAQTSGRQVFRSASNGAWKDQFAGARAGDVVLIDHDILIDSNASVYSLVVRAGGRLRFAPTTNERLDLVNLQVLAGGTLEIGTVAQPHLGKVEIVIRDVPFDLAKDPGQYGNGILVLGTVSMVGRPIENTYVNTSGDLRAGIATLAVGDASDWQAGDKILIPDSRQQFYTAPTVAGLTHYETGIVQSASSNTLKLTTALGYDHLGARDSSDTLVFKPYVANLSRNIVIRSENPSGVRGHTMFIEHATVDIRYVEFRDLGRTLNATPLDNTEFNAQGVATKIGKNQVGRYALHIHHLVGPEDLPDGTPQFRVSGNSINNTTENDFRWGLALHDSHYGLVDKNVVYNVAGAGIVTEDGTESFNTFSQNFVSRIPGTRNRGKFSDGTEGSGFWFKRPNNYVNDNVVTGADKAAYAIYGGDNTDSPPVRIPAFKGADPHENGQYRLLAPKLMNMLSFNNNEAFASHMGLEIWYLGFKTYYDPADEPVAQSFVSGFKGWNLNLAGVFGEQANNLRFENLRLYNFHYDVNNVPFGIVLVRSKDVSINNATIEHFYTGVIAPTRLDRLGPTIPLADIHPFIISNSKLRNFINITIGMAVEDASPMASPRNIQISNIDFDDDPKNPTPNKTDIQMMYSEGRFTNIMQPTVVEVTSYNRDPRSNFQLFFKEQAPEFVVPVTGLYGPGSPTGAPVAGLTNAQLWERYGVAVAGQVAPAGPSSGSRLTYPNVNGLAFPLTRSNTGIAILSISPDTGNVGDRRTSSQRVIVSGVANPGSELAIWDGSSQVGLVRASAAGLWSIDLSAQPLATGRHSLIAKETGTSNKSDIYDFDILTSSPSLTVAPVSIPEDLAVGSLVQVVTANDADLGDSLKVEIVSGNEQGVFQFNATDGRITLAKAKALDATNQPIYRLKIRATDSVALFTEATLEITVTKRPPGYWITQLDYTQFPNLSPAEITFLTPQQIATIPDATWFSRIPTASRVVLSPTQLATLNTGVGGMLTLLSGDQQATLPSDRFASVWYGEFPSVIPIRVPDLSPAQFRAIPDAYWFGIISATARAKLTVQQIQSIPVAKSGIMDLLTSGQRSLISDSQIASLGYTELRFISSDRASAITTVQLSAIPDWYWLGQVQPATLASLNATQVNALNVGKGGMLIYLSAAQLQMLSDQQIASLGYQELRYVSSNRASAITAAQLSAIPDWYWLAQIQPTTRANLSAAQVNALNVGKGGMLFYLTAAQLQMLSDQQIASMGYQELRYVPSQRASAITAAQLSLMPDSYWLGQIQQATRAALNATQVNGINVARGGMLALLPEAQIQMLNLTRIRSLGYTDFRYLPPEQIVKLSREQLVTVRDDFWYYVIPLASRQALTAAGARWINGSGFVFS